MDGMSAAIVEDGNKKDEHECRKCHVMSKSAFCPKCGTCPSCHDRAPNGLICRYD